MKLMQESYIYSLRRAYKTFGKSQIQHNSQSKMHEIVKVVREQRSLIWVSWHCHMYFPRWV